MIFIGNAEKKESVVRKQPYGGEMNICSVENLNALEASITKYNSPRIYSILATRDKVSASSYPPMISGPRLSILAQRSDFSTSYELLNLPVIFVCVSSAAPYVDISFKFY